MPTKVETPTHTSRTDHHHQPVRHDSGMLTQHPLPGVDFTSPGTTPAQRVVGRPPGSQATVQTQTSNAPVPIPRLSSSGSISNPNQPQPVATNGPMSGHVNLPERAKPGRKPKQQSDETNDVRKEQNRKAQRGFRERKRARIEELEEALQSQRVRYEGQLRDQEIQHEQSRQDWQKQIETLKKRNSDLERQLQTTATRVEAPEEIEIDFTRAFQKPSVRTESTSTEEKVMGENDLCGFCTDRGNCYCIHKAPASLQPAVPVEPELRGPGDCDACRADPAKAKACRDLAQQTDMYPNFRAENGRALHSLTLPSINNADMPPPSKKARISCSQMLDRFSEKGQRLASIAEIFGDNHIGKLHSYPVAQGGYEVEEKEAAHVLQTLSQQNRYARSPSAVSPKTK